MYGTNVDVGMHSVVYSVQEDTTGMTVATVVQVGIVVTFVSVQDSTTDFCTTVSYSVVTQ